MASLKFNVAANYAGQAYTAAINVLILPVQIRILGAESYGLVGFFAVLSGWLQLLDVGLAATLARETSSFRAGSLSQSEYRRLLSVVERLFLLIGATSALAVVAGSRLIATNWLRADRLSNETVATAVALMGVVFALRWQSTLSRSILVGLERQVAVNAISCVMATLRSVAVLGVLVWVDRSPLAFFVFQGFVAALEYVTMRVAASRTLALPEGERVEFGIQPLRRVAGFSLRVAASGAVWVVVTQMDKLVLSKLLPLSEFALFSMAVAAASGVSMLAGPIGQAVQPRLTYFAAMSNERALRATYSEATQVLSAVALTGALVAAICGTQVLWVWTGDFGLAQRLAPIFSLYVVGNGVLALVTMTYYLQVARGDLRLHLRGNVVFAAVIVPAIAFATWKRGMYGSAVAWCGANLFFLFLWSAIVHREFLPGGHWKWLLVDTALPSAVGACPALAALSLPWASLSRLEAAAFLVAIGGGCLASAAAATRPARRVFRALRAAA